MIILWFLIFNTALRIIESHPQAIKIPEINVSPPEDVNNLHQRKFQHVIEKHDKTKVEETIKEVEDLLRTNPALPRLTRGEILDILDNITNQDNQSRDAKAIMVVMPFTPSSNKNMEELYTKPPVTHIIGGEPFKTDKERQSDEETTVKTTSTVLRRRRPEVTTEKITTTIRPRSRRPTKRRITTTKHPNHKYPEETTKPFRGHSKFSNEEKLPSEGLKVIEAPKLVPEDTDLHLEKDITKEAVLKQEIPVAKPEIDIPLPDSLKTLVKDLNLDQNFSEVKLPTIDDKIKINNLFIPETTTVVTDAVNVAENLSPEMRELLMNFGLLPNPNQQPIEVEEKYIPEKAEVKPESYVGFKPLPEDPSSRDDMDALLASFGLGRNARRHKSLSTHTKSLNFDVVPENYRQVITDLGLDRESKKIRSDTIQKITEKHVFNPDEKHDATDEELNKLAKLLDMIKQLETLNGTATDEDLKKIDMATLQELVTSLNKNNDLGSLDQIKGPDPNNFDYELNRNEIKRQTVSTTQTTTTNATESSTEPTTTSTNSSTTEESRNGALSDLEASFGGQTSTEAPVETTTSKRTGFYYLLDWNSFLDIDDQKGKRVNLRFQPKAGDPNRFYSVNVP